MKYPTLSRQKPSGFTLIEIMIVVIILGVIITMALPALKAVRERALVSTFVNDFGTFEEAINRYSLEEGEYPADTTDALFLEYIRNDLVSDRTVIGGRYFAQDSGTAYEIGVNGYTVNDRIAIMIDEELDDGNLGSGRLTGGGGSIRLTIEG
ncbi:MAG: prepilin-type N-terminal cleavage/methylation domain-containing protein [Verrucomicrobiota bacterium]